MGDDIWKKKNRKKKTERKNGRCLVEKKNRKKKTERKNGSSKFVEKKNQREKNRKVLKMVTSMNKGLVICNAT